MRPTTISPGRTSGILLYSQMREIIVWKAQLAFLSIGMAKDERGIFLKRLQRIGFLIMVKGFSYGDKLNMAFLADRM